MLRMRASSPPDEGDTVRLVGMLRRQTGRWSMAQSCVAALGSSVFLETGFPSRFLSVRDAGQVFQRLNFRHIIPL